MEKQKTEEELTIEKLKTFKGFESVTDEQAEKIIMFLDELVDILYLRIAEMEHEEKDNNTNTDLTKNKVA